MQTLRSTLALARISHDGRFARRRKYLKTVCPWPFSSAPTACVRAIVRTQTVVSKFLRYTAEFASSSIQALPQTLLSHAILVVVSILFFSPRSSAADELVVGRAAPAFSLINAADSTVSLSQYSGKTVVLEWFNQSCPFVKKFYRNGNMQRFQKQARDQGIVWLTINSSAKGKTGYIDPSEASEVAKAHGLYPALLLLDPHGPVAMQYGARVTPNIFLLDSKGTLAYAGAIDSSPSTNSSDIETATNYVMLALEALKQGRAPSPSSTEAYGCGVKYAS